MKQFILKELRQAFGQLLTEEKIDDFFKFLAQDPQSKSMATVYYTAPVTMNKFMYKIDYSKVPSSSADANFAQSMLDAEANKIKVPNPMFGKLYKNTRFKFRWGDVYKDAIARVNPEHEFGKRSGTYDKVEGFKVTEMGKSGLYLPIIPTGSESSYSVMDNGQFKPIDKEEVKEFLPPYRGASASGVEYRQLIVDRIAMIKSGGNEWKNPNFKGPYMGVGSLDENED